MDVAPRLSPLGAWDEERRRLAQRLLSLPQPRLKPEAMSLRSHLSSTIIRSCLSTLFQIEGTRNEY